MLGHHGSLDTVELEEEKGSDLVKHVLYFILYSTGLSYVGECRVDLLPHNNYFITLCCIQEEYSQESQCDNSDT